MDLKLIQEKYGGKYKKFPIYKELLSDFITPIEVLRKLKAYEKHCFILESVEDSKQWGRYSFLGCDPKLCITANHGNLYVDGKYTKDNPHSYIRKVIKENSSPTIEDLPTFTGGLVGYFAYDYFKYSETSLQIEVEDDEGFYDLDLMLFDTIICFDHLKQRILLITNITIEDIEASYLEGNEKLNQFMDILLNGKRADIEPLQLNSPFTPLFNQVEFMQMVDRAKKYIIDGDIFQVVLSNRLEASASGSLFDTYRLLRTTNPSPYMFYFTSSELEIAGASPETLVKLEGNTLHTFPLAGTRPRGKTREEDLALEKELLADQKELAEHNMLVDLGRNDIGKISKIGSVEVEKYMEIERYSHVMHIGSTVKGIIRDDLDAIDAINSILPAGTLSGAPKIRACEIIHELEHNKRGIYGGAVGYIDFSGNLDVCIAIRLAYKKNQKVYARSGAGIVYDSIPENEYIECINKIKAVTNALEKANGGINHDLTNR